MLKDLNSILRYIDRLNELDTSNVEPMAQVASRYGTSTEAEANAMRPDEPRPSLPHDSALRNAPRLRRRLLQGAESDRALVMDLDLLTVDSIRTAVLERQTTASATVDACYEKIEAEDAAIGAYLTLCKERAYQQARWVDAMVGRGDALPPLAGVPIAVKDVLITKACARRPARRFWQLHRALRRDGGHAAGSGRRHRARQDQLR